MACRRAYLDIETAGGGRAGCCVTVVGLAVERPRRLDVVQLVDPRITETAVARVLEGVDRVYTYNGTRFDLPVLRRFLRMDPCDGREHRDLMYDCWRHGLKGGLKAVEQRLGIRRRTAGIDGHMAVRLWWDYVLHRDCQALRTLLLYNREDVLHLATLRRRLGVD